MKVVDRSAIEKRLQWRDSIVKEHDLFNTSAQEEFSAPLSPDYRGEGSRDPGHKRLKVVSTINYTVNRVVIIPR